jgi:hypothetical protein
MCGYGRSLVAKTLSLGEYEFVEAWREGGVKYVKLKTKPNFSTWVRAILV